MWGGPDFFGTLKLMNFDKPLGLDFVLRTLRKTTLKKKTYSKEPSLKGSEPSFLSERWGPGLENGEPSISIPYDWRHWVAGLPHEVWRWWDRRWWSLREQKAKELGRDPTADEIEACQHEAYLDLTQRN